MVVSVTMETEEITGGILSIKFTVLLIWVVLDTLPSLSKIAFTAGVIVSTSFPSGVPDRLMPKVKVFPFADTLVGIRLSKVAVPPSIERSKSAESSAPDSLSVLNTGTLNVTATVLSVTIKTDVITGLVWSYKFVVLLLWDVFAAIPAASKIALSTKATVTTSLPFGIPDKLRPRV